jgi:hypothetical protein
MYTCNQTLHRDKGKRHVTDNNSNQDDVLFMRKQTLNDFTQKKKKY